MLDLEEHDLGPLVSSVYMGPMQDERIVKDQ